MASLTPVTTPFIAVMDIGTYGTMVGVGLDGKGLERVKLTGQDNEEMISRKYRTAAIYKKLPDGNWDPFLWGDAAARNRFKRYSFLTHYVENFKLYVYDETPNDWTWEISPEQVLQDFIKEIFKCIWRDWGHLSKHPLHIIMTIPVKNTAAKQRRIQEALRGAGVYDNRDPGTTKLSLLPEAKAAMLHTLNTMITKKQIKSIPNGRRLLQVDIGGGSVDAVANQLVLHEDVWSMKEVSMERGCFAGGNDVDKAFDRYLLHKLGETWTRFLAMEDTLGQNTLDYARKQVFDAWEAAKRNYSGRGALSVALPLPLQREIQRDAGGGIAMDEIQLTEAEARGLFLPTFKTIIAMIRAHYEGVYDDILFNGGFANSWFFQLTMLKEFDPDVYYKISVQAEEHRKTGARDFLRQQMSGTIRLTEEPEQAVYRGAYVYGQYPDLIASRVLTQTYGLLYYRAVNDLKDHELAASLPATEYNRGNTRVVDKYRLVFHPCKSVSDQVDTTKFYFAGKMLPAMIHDTSIALWVVSSDQPVTKRCGKVEKDEVEYETMLLPPLPYTIKRYVAKLSAKTAHRTSLKGKTLSVYLRFKVDAIDVRLIVDGRVEDEVYFVEKGA